MDNNGDHRPGGPGGRGAPRRAHRLHGERIDPVVRVVVVHPRGDVTEDPVVFGDPEVVVDDLGDAQGSVGPKLDRDVVAVDLLGELGAGDARGGEQRTGGDDEGRDHPSHGCRCSTKKNEMAMIT